MDNKVKFCFLFLILLLVSLSNKIFYVGIMTISITTIFYNLQKGVSVYLLLGFTGIYLATLVKKSRETFQNNEIITTPSQSTTIVDTPIAEEEECVPNSSMSLSLTDFKELQFIFDALFQINESRMKVILKENCIQDLFTLKKYIENYRNRPENKIDINSWEYSGKAHVLSKLIPVYLLDAQQMVKLINTDDITLNKLRNNEIRNVLFGVDSVQHLALQYYFNEKKMNKKHFKMLTALDLQKDLPKGVRDNLSGLLISQNYYSKHIKNIVGILVVFEYLGYLGNDIESDWGKTDLNGDIWVEAKINQINIEEKTFTDNPLFNTYGIGKQILLFLDKVDTLEKQELKKEFDFSKPVDELTEELRQQALEAKDNIKFVDKENAIESLNYIEDDINEHTELEFNNVENLVKKSNSTLNDVVDEVIMLFKNVSSTTYTPENKVNNLITKYLVFVKELMNILTRDQRMLFVGLFLMILAFIVSLIEINV